MNSRTLFYLLLASVFVINASGVAAFVWGNKMLTIENNKLTQLKVEAGTLETVQRSLVTAKKDIETYSPIEQIVKTVVPQEKDQAKTVREIIKLAEESNIAIASITFPSSNLGAKAVGGAPLPSAGGAAGTITQTQKVEGISNLERLEINVGSESSKPVLFTEFVSFLERLEQNRRTAQVSSISIQPDKTNRNRLTFTLILNVYIKK